MGSSGVGKSALACRFVFKKFNKEHSVTFEDTYCKKVIVDDEQIEVEILDTSG